jgi:hypothetical protein
MHGQPAIDRKSASDKRAEMSIKKIYIASVLRPERANNGTPSESADKVVVSR